MTCFHKALLTALLYAVHSAAALGCQTERADIRFHGDAYRYEFSALVGAPAATVLDIITAHTRLDRINNNIVESRVLQRYGDHQLKRFMRLERCIIGFCFDLKFTETVVESPAKVTTTIVPTESSFRDGVTTWEVEALDEQRTRLRLQATQTPDFWIPPLIGPVILKRVFVREVQETCARIETLGTTTMARRGSK